MGEEAKQEEARPEAKPEEKGEKKQEEKKEEKAEEKSEETKEEEKKEEAKPSPPAPTVLFVDLHCVGCAKKIERSILKCRGVQAVEIDMVTNQVTVKGIVDPQALCDRIKKRAKMNAKVLSPLPPEEGDVAKTDSPAPQNVSGVTTVELHVNMHCEACAQQLRRKILKMRGVQTAETNLSSGQVTVTGTVEADKLVEYVYRRTRKLAKVVPQPPKGEEPKKEEGQKKEEEKAPEGNKEESKEEAKKEEEKAEEKGGEKPADDGGAAAKEEKPVEGGGEEPKTESEENPVVAVAAANVVSADDDMAKKMMYYAPIYVIERLPPPQLFSDENPNACCIS